MSIIVKAPEKSVFPQLPAGNYQGVCYAIKDIGTHSFEYQGETKRAHKVVLLYEVDELIQIEGTYKDKRYVVSEELTLSLHEKAKLRQRIEGWFGRELSEEELDGFDLESLVGRNGMLNIISSKKGYPIIDSVSQLGKKMNQMIPENTQAPAWIEKKWQESEEYQALQNPSADIDPDLQAAIKLFSEESK